MGSKRRTLLGVVFSITLILASFVVFHSPQKAYAEGETKPVTYNISWNLTGGKGYYDPALNGQAVKIPVRLEYYGGGQRVLEPTVRTLDLVVGTNKAFVFDLPVAMPDGTPVDNYSLRHYLDADNRIFSLGSQGDGFNNITYALFQNASAKVEMEVNVPADVQQPTILPDVTLVYPDQFGTNRTQTLPLKAGVTEIADSAAFSSSGLNSIYRGIYDGVYSGWNPFTGQEKIFKMTASLPAAAPFALQLLDGGNTSGDDANGWKLIADLKADAVRTITFDPTDKATVTGTTVKKVVAGEKMNETTLASVPEPVPVDGYTFAGWSLDGDTLVNPASLVINEDTWLIGVFDEIYLAVSFDTGEGTPVRTQYIVWGGRAVQPADPVREGYVFKGWTLEGENYDFAGEVKADLMLVAQWEEDPQEGQDPVQPTPAEPSPADPAAPAGKVTAAKTPKTGDGNGTILLLIGMASASALVVLGRNRKAKQK